MNCFVDSSSIFHDKDDLFFYICV